MGGSFVELTCYVLVSSHALTDVFTSTLVQWIGDALAKDYPGQLTKQIAAKL